MSERLESLIQQLETVFYGNPWYGNGVIEKFNKIDVDISSKTPPNGVHSIPQLIIHMTSWKQYVLEKMSGNNSYHIINDSEIEWPKQSQVQSFDFAIENLRRTHDELISALKENNDEWLNTIVPPTKFNYDTLIQGIIHHDIYHLGQIGIVYNILASQPSSE